MNDDCMEDRSDAIKDQKNCEQKHADVFSEVHCFSIPIVRSGDNLKRGIGALPMKYGLGAHVTQSVLRYSIRSCFSWLVNFVP